MIRSKDSLGGTGLIHHGPQLSEEPFNGRHFKPAPLSLLGQWRVGYHRHRERREKSRVHLGYQPCGLPSMLNRAVLPNSKQCNERHLHTSFVSSSACRHVRIKVITFGNALECHIITRLGTNIELAQTSLTQGAKLIGALLVDVPRHGVTRYTPQLRKECGCTLENRHPIIHGHDEAITVSHKYLVDPRTEPTRRNVEIL